MGVLSNMKNLMSYIGMGATLVAFLGLSYFLLFYRATVDWKGVLIETMPSQVDINGGMEFTFKGAVIKPLAYYKVDGVVLNTTQYFLDDLADIAPMDMILAWGNMSSGEVINNFDYNYEDRYFEPRPNYKVNRLVTPDDLAKSVSNIICIPASEKIYDQMLRIKRFDAVELRGYLVYLRTSKFECASSITIEDELIPGSFGSARIIYIDKVDILNPKKN